MPKIFRFTSDFIAMDTSNNTPDNDLLPSGRRYKSVPDMLRQQGASELAERVEAHAKKTRVSNALALMRMRAGLTQKQFAEKAKMTQGAVSKIEGMEDEKLSLFHLKIYASVTGINFSLEVGKPLPAAQRVKHYAIRMHDALKELAELSKRYDDLREPIRRFHGEVCENLFYILVKCSPPDSADGNSSVKRKSRVSLDMYSDGDIPSPSTAGEKDMPKTANCP